MDPSLRSNGSNTRLPTQPSVRTAVRSRLAGRVERVLNSALAGERAAVLNATSAELLADPVAAAARICGAARLSESIVWIADLLQDASPPVQDAAVRSLSRLGGRRAVEQIMASADG